MTLALEDAAYRRAQQRVDSVHVELADAQRHLSLAVGALLGGGWTGVAADRFGAGWREWESGCGRGLAGLAGMQGALEATYLATHDTDSAQGRALSLLRARLGGAC
jgi:hypothetical protein